MPEKPPLDDLLGRKVQVDGHEWTVRLSRITGQPVLERELPDGFEVLLKALREGAAVLDTDPAIIAVQPLPVARVAATQEWLYLDAIIAGAGQHGRLAPEGIELLERRLAQLTAFLSSQPTE